jgi:hypothetical protein
MYEKSYRNVRIHLLTSRKQVSDSKAAYYVRAACLAAGFPTTTAASSVNRFCSSGLKAVQDIAAQIQTGAIEIGVAVGAEHMSTGGDRLERPFVPEIVNANQHAADCLRTSAPTSTSPVNSRTDTLPSHTDAQKPRRRRAGSTTRSHPLPSRSRTLRLAMRRTSP